MMAPPSCRLVKKFELHTAFGAFDAHKTSGCTIHPYAGNQNAGYILVDLDRAGPTAVDLMRANGHDPCVVVQTSPGHATCVPRLQAWIRLSASRLESAVAHPTTTPRGCDSSTPVRVWRRAASRCWSPSGNLFNRRHRRFRSTGPPQTLAQPAPRRPSFGAREKLPYFARQKFPITTAEGVSLCRPRGPIFASGQMAGGTARRPISFTSSRFSFRKLCGLRPAARMMERQPARLRRG